MEDDHTAAVVHSVGDAGTPQVLGFLRRHVCNENRRPALVVAEVAQQRQHRAVVLLLVAQLVRVVDDEEVRADPSLDGLRLAHALFLITLSQVHAEHPGLDVAHRVLGEHADRHFDRRLRLSRATVPHESDQPASLARRLGLAGGLPIAGVLPAPLVLEGVEVPLRQPRLHQPLVPLPLHAGLAGLLKPGRAFRARGCWCRCSRQVRAHSPCWHVALPHPTIGRAVR